MSGGPEAVKRYHAPEYRRLLRAARRRLENNGGSLDGPPVRLGGPDEAERNAIIGITGRHRGLGAGTVSVTLRELDAVVRAGTGLTLAGLLEALDGRPLANRPAEAARALAARREALGPAEQSPLHESAEWFRTWLGAVRRNGTVGRLIARPETVGVLAQAVAVLEFLEARPEGRAPVTLAGLAAEVTGDPKALNHRTTLSTLVLRALAIRESVPLPGTAEGRRELWDHYEVVVDDLASRILVLNLPAEGEGLGEWLTGAARFGTPFQVTLHQLSTFSITLRAPVVHVCENPAVLRRAAAELGPGCPPLVCTEGRPSTAFHRLAAVAVRGGARLRYHGDFDWPGVDMAGAVARRHGAELWRMTAADYLAGLGDAVKAGGREAGDGEAADGEGRVGLTGRPVPTPWDPALAEAMREHGAAVYEEAVADPLLADLRE
ncbi:TIGR02679 family protein [Microbispora sp. H10836]|uniref:TIGR02679 family protein n=1 Tax=Microbispora sp. H10836 TaxID=2729106 RepID=UPI0014753620|nr:TIGR02679 family protein [Microbispora sp. H10836]